MYAMSTGHPPFRAETVYAVMQRIVHDTPRSIREQNPKNTSVARAVHHATAAQRKSQRFNSASDVAKLLQEELAYLQNAIAANKPTRAWFVESEDQSKNIAAEKSPPHR